MRTCEIALVIGFALYAFDGFSNFVQADGVGRVSSGKLGLGSRSRIGVPGVDRGFRGNPNGAGTSDLGSRSRVDSPGVNRGYRANPGGVDQSRLGNNFDRTRGTSESIDHRGSNVETADGGIRGNTGAFPGGQGSLTISPEVTFDFSSSQSVMDPSGPPVSAPSNSNPVVNTQPDANGETSSRGQDQDLSRDDSLKKDCTDRDENVGKSIIRGQIVFNSDCLNHRVSTLQ